MMLRRHRLTPDVDPAFSLKPVETMDPAFGPQTGHDGFVDSDVVNDSRLPAANVAEELRGEALKDALRAVGLNTSGTADERRARYAEFLAEQESVDPEGGADPARDPAEPEE